MLSRRGFFGLVAAAVVAPFVPAPAPVRPKTLYERFRAGTISEHAGFWWDPDAALVADAQRRYNAATSAMLEMKIQSAADLAFVSGDQWRR